MTGIGVPEMMIIFVMWLPVPAVVGYGVIRLAVRPGVLDAQRRLPGGAPIGQQGIATAP
jgi:hypothetical protein